MDISFEVLHALPGRLRLRVPEIRNNQPLADIVAERLIARRGVTSVRTNITCASVLINYDTSVLGIFRPRTPLKLRQVKASKELARNGNGHSNGHRETRIAGLWNRYGSLVMPTVAMGATLSKFALPVAPVYAMVAAAAAPVFHRAAQAIRKDRRLGVDFLDATAIAIMGVQRNLPTCAFMAWLIGIGEHIREATARKSQKAIAELIEFNGEFAVVMVGRRRVKVPVKRLAMGDRVVVNAGEVIPVDGCVISGRAGIDQGSLTGEAGLQERCVGDEVFAGSKAVDGELIIEAKAVGLDTRAGKIVQMLRSAPMQETRIEDYAARFADRLVLPTFAASGAVYALSGSLARALSMLIVDFGTGVRVAAPTAFLSSMACAAQRNIVIKGGRAMERLAAVDTVVFDKTGTLTMGVPEVRSVIPLDRRYTPRSIVKIAAAAELGLNHPVANALVSEAESMGIRIPNKVEARLRVGMGVRAVVAGRSVAVGSEKLFEEDGIDISAARTHAGAWSGNSESPLYVACNGKPVGVITYADRIRPESREVVSKLKDMGVSEVVMLTGDRRCVAREVSDELGMDRYVADLFPDHKLDFIKRLHREGRTVAVVGDGINDTLALAHADVAIAPAGANDAAKEAADVLLMEDSLWLLVEAFAIAKAAVSLVRQNYKIVAVPNAGAIALAASGLLGPPGATLINNGSTVAAGLNGLRPLLGRNRAASKNGSNGNGHGPKAA